MRIDRLELRLLRLPLVRLARSDQSRDCGASRRAIAAARAPGIGVTLAPERVRAATEEQLELRARP